MSHSDKRFEKGEETYRRVIQAALEIISEQGVSGITASRLSERAQISKSSVFHHFPSTQAIPSAVLKTIMETMVRPLESMPEETALQDYLLGLGDAVCQMTAAHRLVYKAFFSFYHESMFNDSLRLMMTAFLKESVASLQEALGAVRGDKGVSQTQNIENKQQIEQISYLILSTLDGMGLHLLMGESPEFYQKAWALQVEWIVRCFNENG